MVGYRRTGGREGVLSYLSLVAGIAGTTMKHERDSARGNQGLAGRLRYFLPSSPDFIHLSGRRAPLKADSYYLAFYHVLCLTLKSYLLC